MSGLTITLPKGKEVEAQAGDSALDIAKAHAPSQLPQILAAKFNDTLVDLRDPLTENGTLTWVTQTDETDGLEIIRHSCAHLLAQAVQQLYPNMQVTIGPVIENGFYYDFAGEHKFTPEDLDTIEARMNELMEQKIEISKKLISRSDAIALFDGMGEAYKVEIIKDIPESDALSLFSQGDFTDLCRGPHAQHTGQLRAFKLTRVAGAYWRGDSDNEMLQRIYGVAFADKGALKAYLRMMEEAAKRDHRLVGNEKMKLFTFSEYAPGMPFFLKHGQSLFTSMVEHIRRSNKKYGYRELATPQMLDIKLWQKSGHWDKFGMKNEMFTIEDKGHMYALRPMNCPCHVEVFNSDLRSYRDLPLRFAEFGRVHRNEPSGTLHGLKRARAFTQDDGHIFCTEEHIEAESAAFIDQTFEVYKAFGFTDIVLKLALRPDSRVGTDEMWDLSEETLSRALSSKGLEFETLPGEGAFYGPKIEFHLKDSIGRLWQCGTLQLDFSIPDRLDARYIDADGNKKVPVMLHRAIFGSLERFMAILIENYDGRFPLWLAPVQFVVANLTDDQKDYALSVAEQLSNAGLRIETDVRNEKINLKIREHSMARVPFLLTLGDREMEANTLSVRDNTQKTSQTMTIEALLEWAKAQPMMNL